MLQEILRVLIKKALKIYKYNFFYNARQYSKSPNKAFDKLVLFYFHFQWQIKNHKTIQPMKKMARRNQRNLFNS